MGAPDLLYQSLMHHLTMGEMRVRGLPMSGKEIEP
jgi:hypothetical protein